MLCEVPEGLGKNSLWQHRRATLLCWSRGERREWYYFGFAEAAVAGFRIPVLQEVLWSKS